MVHGNGALKSLKLSPRDFVFNLQLFNLGHLSKSVSKMVNLWSLEENEVSKCRQENYTKVCVNILIMLPHKVSDLKF